MKCNVSYGREIAKRMTPKGGGQWYHGNSSKIEVQSVVGLKVQLNDLFKKLDYDTRAEKENQKMEDSACRFLAWPVAISEKIDIEIGRKH